MKCYFGKRTSAMAENCTQFSASSFCAPAGTSANIVLSGIVILAVSLFVLVRISLLCLLIMLAAVLLVHLIIEETESKEQPMIFPIVA